MGGALGIAQRALDEIVAEAGDRQRTISRVVLGERGATVTFAYRYGGGPALYSSHPLQRCFRDLHAATQHGVVSEENYEFYGRALLGRAKWDAGMGRPLGDS